MGRDCFCLLLQLNSKRKQLFSQRSKSRGRSRSYWGTGPWKCSHFSVASLLINRMGLVFCRKVFFGWLDLLWVLQALLVVGQQISWRGELWAAGVTAQKKILRTDPEELNKQYLRRNIVSGRVMLDTGPSEKTFLFFWSSGFLFLWLYPNFEQRRTLWYLATWQTFTPSRKIQMFVLQPWASGALDTLTASGTGGTSP